MVVRIALSHEKIEAFCRKHGIRRLSLFGSVLRDDFGPESDVDVLVEFEPDATPGWEIVSIRDELSELLGRPVDLGTPNSLSHHIREEVLASMEVIYE
jgi:predicted nucleotidyltransferase